MHSFCMSEIHDFILERLHEDSTAALAVLYRQDSKEYPTASSGSAEGSGRGAQWVLDECAIQREIVDIHSDVGCSQCLANREYGCETVRLLAKAWRQHHDYHPDWSSLRDGDSQISPRRAREILEELSTSDCPRQLHLTERETDVLQLTRDGARYSDIGEQLFTSVNAVANHVRNALTKSHMYRRWGDGPRGPTGWPA
jgi:hypothetical protein